MYKATISHRSAKFVLATAFALFLGNTNNTATAQNLLTNGGCDAVPTVFGEVPTGWTQDDFVDDWYCADEPHYDIPSADGTYHFFPNSYSSTNLLLTLYQRVDVSADATAIDAGTEALDFSAKYRDDAGSSLDETRFSVRFYDAGLSPINGGANNWTSTAYDGDNTGNYNLVANAGISIPVGTRIIEMFFDCEEQDFDDYCAYTYDTFVLEYATSLPVELTDFRAHVDGHAAVLSWSTATEANSAGFDVERTQGDETWTSMVFSPATGESDRGAAYQYRTENLSPGTHRFRLKMVDSDGSFSFSPVVEVDVFGSGSAVLDKPYPNPFTTSTRVTVSVPTEQRVTVSVYNILGKQIEVLHDGTIPANSATNFTFDGTNLPGGLYMVRAHGATFTSTQSVILQK